MKLDLTARFQIPLHFIGNPPFGRQSSIAKKFMKHICKCEKTKSFGFILPKSFKKPSMQQCIPLDFHMISEIDIQDNGFMVNGKDYDVPCIFQVWERRNENRYIEPKLEPKGFHFVKNKMDKNVELTEKVNHDILGGTIIKVGDFQIDDSVRKQLKELKNRYNKNLFIKDF